MDGKFGNFELEEEDIYSQAPGADQSRWYVQSLKEIIAQKNEPVARPSFGPSMELRPRFSR